MSAISLNSQFIYRIVNQYIGVSGGYLGDFTNKSHREFYYEYCDVGINADEFVGTNRERFIAILSGVAPSLQAQILRGVILRFPVGQTPSPVSRTEELRSQIETMIRELERGPGPAFSLPTYNVEIVHRAITDAETLIKTSGATSAVDRIHTALHGFLMRVCRDGGIGLQDEAMLPGIFKALRLQHPAFRAVGPRSQDIVQIMRAVGSILDVLNPLRNQASMAHPNEELLEPEEAMLVINVSRSILQYLDEKLPSSSTD